MGLTGIIIEAQLKTIPLINSARLRVIKFENLEELFRKIESYRYTQEYIIGLVNWQSLRPGSGKIFTIEFHQKSSKKFKLSPSSNILPLTFPFINKFTIFIYNLFYFANYKFEKNINPFKIIFLADKFRNVNRWFGRKGFIEYQFSIPKNEIKVAIWIMQDFKQNFTIYLSGVKLLSDMSIGLMNFVQEGYTITLTTTPSKKLFSYLHKYDRVLGKVGGKVYLAKDSRMASHNFNKMYPDLQKFRDIRIKYRLQKFSSDLSVRLKF
jgi:hypothetical protein